MFLFENVDSMILYHLVLILFSNIFFTVIGLLSQSRYALIAIARFLFAVLLDTHCCLRLLGHTCPPMHLWYV